MRGSVLWVAVHSVTLAAMIASAGAQEIKRRSDQALAGTDANEQQIAFLSRQVPMSVSETLVSPKLPEPRQSCDEHSAPESNQASRELRRHHLYVQLGLFNNAAKVIELGDLDLRLDEIAGWGHLGYRYSLNPSIDLAIELRHWIGRWPLAPSGQAKLAGGFIGPGIRIYGMNRTKTRRVLPYLQGNLFYVQEQLGEPNLGHEHGIGFGLSGGLDLELNRLISIPIEAVYVRNVAGGGLHDLSGVGITVGINFNF